MQDNKLIQEFIEFLNYEKHFSSHTVKCYSADLRQFIGFLVTTKAESNQVVSTDADSQVSTETVAYGNSNAESVETT